MTETTDMTRQPDGVAWRHLELRDIPRLVAFAPEDWHISLDAVLLQHVGRAYFHGRVGSAADGIVAVGHGIVTGRTGWVGNIIVRPDARNRGLGRRMTEEVLASLREHGCASALLVSTPMGEPVYRTLGFRRTADYVFLEVPRLPSPATEAIRRLNASDFDDVLRLDAGATGETRIDLLAPYLASGWAHFGEAGRLDGFFLPYLGAGLVVADAQAAGCALLHFKHALFPGAAVVPAANTAALKLLLAHGARETARAPRMVLGEEAGWRPEWVFARAAGYCG